MISIEGEGTLEAQADRTVGVRVRDGHLEVGDEEILSSKLQNVAAAR